MTHQPSLKVHVFYMQRSHKISMGHLGLKNRTVYFEYNSEFIKTNLQLSPFQLPLKPGIIACEDRVFNGLFGVFNDSLPDGWGRLLLDRKLMSLNIHPQSLSVLDRLCYVGHQGMGALLYEPEIEGSTLISHHELDDINQEALEFQKTQNSEFIDELLTLNGSSAGARPKILTQINFEDWIIKLHSYLDVKDSGPIEYAYHLMAKEAELDVPLAKLFPSKKGFGYFGVQRFDRDKKERIHMHSISGLLNIDHQASSLDYEMIMKLTLWLTQNPKEYEKQFKAAVFNILTHNRDDHAKNFSFLMNKKGIWQVSPAYDLTFSSGPGGEHCSTVMGEGKKPTLTHLLKLAEVAQINKQTALDIIESIKIAVSKWKILAEQAGVSSASIKQVQKALSTLS